MYVTIPNINDINHRIKVMSISLFLLKHAAISETRKSHAITTKNPRISAIVPATA